jgi:hypothetical protein
MSNDSIKLPLNPLPSPSALRRRFDFLNGQRASELRSRDDLITRIDAIKNYLNIADAVEEALEKLSDQLFGELVRVIETNLTVALCEVLEQPISLKVERQFKRGVATMAFHIERDGQREDIIRGQGGSVANVLSVGLRLFALTTLDEKQHRRFLVLDEQDCWLAPDLVPRLVKIVHQAGKALGFQVLMISHHSASMFEQYADKIYRLTPGPDGVQATPLRQNPTLFDDA